MWQYIIFLILKPSKVTSDFILNHLKKVIGVSLLRNIKNKYKNHDIFTMNAPPENPGVSKSTNKLMEVLCTKIESKLNKIWKTVKNRHNFWIIFFQFWRFLKFIQFGLNFSANSDQFHIYKHFLDFLTHQRPWGARHVIWNEFMLGKLSGSHIAVVRQSLNFFLFMPIQTMGLKALSVLFYFFPII